MVEFIFVTGPPGAGKGTLCKRLVKEANDIAKKQGRPLYYHLSIGDFLRKLKWDGTLAKELQEKLDGQQTLSAGELMPILCDQIDLQARAGCGVMVLDGFPRTWDQLEVFEAQMEAPKLLLVLDCAKEEAATRVFERNDATRDATTGRVFQERFEDYQREQPAIAAHYGAKSLSLSTEAEDPGNGDVINDAYGRLRALIQQHEGHAQLVFGSSS